MSELERVPEDSFAMLTREATVRELVPEFSENKRKIAIYVLLAEHSGTDMLQAVTSFSRCVFAGVTPPPSLLAKVAEAFNGYLKARGQLTLDRAFDLQTKQKVGNPFKHRAAQARRGQILHDMWALRKEREAKGEPLSILKAASEVINRLSLSDEEDALTRDYSRLKIQEIFDRAEEALHDLQPIIEKVSKSAEGLAAINDLETFLKK